MAEYLRVIALFLGLFFRFREIAAALTIGALVAAFVHWQTTKIFLEDGYLHINKGAIISKKAGISVSSVCAVATTRSLADIIFGSASVTFFTEAGAVFGQRGIRISAKSEAKLCALLGFVKDGGEVRHTFLQTLLHALSMPSVVTGTLFVIPIMKKVDAVLEENESTIDRIEEFSERIFGLSPLVNLAVAFFLITFLISLLLFVVRNVGLKTFHNDKTVSVSFGVLPQKTVYMRKGAINSTLAVQTPFLFILGRSFIKPDVSGIDYGQSREIYLSAPKIKVKRDEPPVFSCKGDKKIELAPKNHSQAERWRYFTVYFYFAVLFTVVLLSAHILFPWLTDLLLLFAAVLSAILLYYFHLAKYAHRHTSIDFYDGKAHFITGTSAIHANFCPERIGIITVTTFPYDRKTGVCTVKTVLRSQRGTKIKVKYVPSDLIVEQLKNLRVE